MENKGEFMWNFLRSFITQKEGKETLLLSPNDIQLTNHVNNVKGNN